jgi:transcriptional regulator with XRE-family HTH domain
MRLIERIQEYLTLYDISAYEFEHSCGLSNGYVGKQLKGKGSVGSDILEKIKRTYTDLSLIWLVTGKGKMILSIPSAGATNIVSELNEEQNIYFTSKDEVIKLLNKQIAKLEATIADKDKIIVLLEDQLKQEGGGAYKRTR